MADVRRPEVPGAPPRPGPFPGSRFLSNPQECLYCPHCGQPLKRFTIPDAAGWGKPCQWACFNNDCPYYREGWDWMWEQYKVKASYRYRVVEPASGRASPLAVWSETALFDRIVENEED